MKPELHSTRIGKAIALGRGNLTGDYKKISLGLQNTMLFTFYRTKPLCLLQSKRFRKYKFRDFIQLLKYSYSSLSKSTSYQLLT
jgi:hypothetical protein